MWVSNKLQKDAALVEQKMMTDAANAHVHTIILLLFHTFVLILNSG